MTTEERNMERALWHLKKVRTGASEEIVKAFMGSFCLGFLANCFVTSGYVGVAVGWFEAESWKAFAQGGTVGVAVWAALIVKFTWEEEVRQKSRIRKAIAELAEAEKAADATKNQTEVTSVDVEV